MNYKKIKFFNLIFRRYNENIVLSLNTSVNFFSIKNFDIIIYKKDDIITSVIYLT